MTKKIKLCIVGNIQSVHIKKLAKDFASRNYETYIITPYPGKISGIKCYSIPRCSFKFRPLCYILSALEVRKIIRKINPDIVHGFDLVSSGTWVYLSGFHPYIVSSWGTDIFEINNFNFIQRYLIKKSISQSDIFICQADALRDRALKIGAKVKKFELVHFGINLNIFKKKNPSQILMKKLKLKDEKIIFYPRAIDPIYNIDILIYAFAEIKKKYLKDKLTLALLENSTNQKYFQQIKALIKRLELTKSIIFWPRRDNNKIADYYNLAEVVLSIPSSDGCSLVMIEAMACEKKIVVTDLPYIKEWNFKNNLWVVPVRDVKKTVQKILEALRCSGAVCKNKGKFNRNLVYRNAEINDNFNKLDNIYRKMVSESKSIYIV